MRAITAGSIGFGLYTVQAASDGTDLYSAVMRISTARDFLAGLTGDQAEWSTPRVGLSLRKTSNGGAELAFKAVHPASSGHTETLTADEVQRLAAWAMAHGVKPLAKCQHRPKRTVPLWFREEIQALLRSGVVARPAGLRPRRRHHRRRRDHPGQPAHRTDRSQRRRQDPATSAPSNGPAGQPARRSHGGCRRPAHSQGRPDRPASPSRRSRRSGHRGDARRTS